MHVDSIGPWTHKVNGLTVKVRALAMIDPVTNLVEVARTYSTRAEKSSRVFVNTWLSRYPVPEKIVTDGGPEFTGNEWEFMLMDWSLRKGRISAYTPTSNAIIESSHKVMGQILRTFLATENPTTQVALDKTVDKALALTLRSLRCASNTALQGYSPGALVFGRDMHLNIPIIADIITISENRQIQTNLRLERENRRRTRHEYTVGSQVFVNNHFTSSDKLKPAWVGPFPILQVHTNNTVTIQRGQVHERISIRRLKPA